MPGLSGAGNAGSVRRALGGYSYGRSDLVRRAMSKKKMDVMLRGEGVFHPRQDWLTTATVEIARHVCGTGCRHEAAEEIFNQMVSIRQSTRSTSRMRRRMLCCAYETALSEGALSGGIHGGAADQRDGRRGFDGEVHEELQRIWVSRCCRLDVNESGKKFTVSGTGRYVSAFWA